MRLRNDPNAIKTITDNPWLFIDAFNPNLKGNWHQVIFQNKHPIFLEIGCGKGKFIIEQAINHPDINFIGIEKNRVICAKLYHKLKTYNVNITNLKIINGDANKLKDLFNQFEVSKIFLNFSDPWPKKRHHKNRLTHPNFLNLYKYILDQEGLIELKTDNDDFYLWSLDSIMQHQGQVLYNTNDLYTMINNQWNQDNISTEYEQRFVALNKNINKIVFRP